jgi:hypothetical protein
VTPEQEYKRRYYLANRERILRNQAEAYRRDPSERLRQSRRSKLRRFFPDLTGAQAEAEYGRLLAKQHGVCAICKQPETKVDRQRGKIAALSIDHCHATGRVRGLLCFRCNTQLSVVETSLVPLVTYLNAWRFSHE